jgi:hypothetical protein
VVQWNTYNGYEEGFSVASWGGTLGPFLRGFQMDQLQFLAESLSPQQWFGSGVVPPQSIARDFNIGAIFVDSSMMYSQLLRQNGSWLGNGIIEKVC